MRSRLMALFAILALALTGAVIVGCGDDDDDGDTTAAGGEPELITAGTLTVGSDIPFPPFEQGKEPNYEGFDIDLVNAVAEKLDLQVEYQDTAFDTIFRDLAQGKFDLVASATTITPDREKTVDFSDPYYKANQALVTTTDSDIASVEDVAGKTLGAQDGTTGEEYANDETDAASVRGFPEGPDVLNALRAGQVDAAIIDEPVAEEQVEKQGDIEIVQIPTGELYGLVVGQDNDALREQVNDALQELKDDGTLNDIYQEWFQEDAPDEVLDATHEPT